MSDSKLFTNKAEQIVHELKETRSVQKVLKFNIDRIDEILMKHDRKIKELEHQIDQYIVKLFEPKKEDDQSV